MDWQSQAEARAIRAFNATYADAIADGLDESEAEQLAEDAANDEWIEAGEQHITRDWDDDR